MHEEFVKFVNLHGLSGHAYTMALWAFETGHAAGMECAARICHDRACNGYLGSMSVLQDCADAIRAAAEAPKGGQ